MSKVAKLERAKELLQEAVELVSEVFPNDGNVRAYWIEQVSEHIDKGNRFNLDINDLIEKIWDDEKDDLMDEEEDEAEYEDYHSKS